MVARGGGPEEPWHWKEAFLGDEARCPTWGREGEGSPGSLDGGVIPELGLGGVAGMGGQAGEVDTWGQVAQWATGHINWGWERRSEP